MIGCLSMYNSFLGVRSKHHSMVVGRAPGGEFCRSSDGLSCHAELWWCPPHHIEQVLPRNGNTSGFKWTCPLLIAQSVQSWCPLVQEILKEQHHLPTLSSFTIAIITRFVVRSSTRFNCLLYGICLKSWSHSTDAKASGLWSQRQGVVCAGYLVILIMPKFHIYCASISASISSGFSSGLTTAADVVMFFCQM